MSPNICINCGKENEPDFKFCAFCGQKLPYLTCIKCGEKYNKDYKFCGKCGGKLVEKNVQSISGEVYYLDLYDECTAMGVNTDNGFVVLKGARIRKNLVKSAGKGVIESRKQNKSKIKNYITTEDILFPTPAAAASFVGGSNLGRKYWIPEKKYIKNKSSVNKDKSSKYKGKVFYLESDDYFGKGTYDGNVFTLFKGAVLNKFLTVYAEKQVVAARRKNRSKINDFVTTDKIQFDSPSAAATFIAGTVVNGREEWKNADGKSINDIMKE